MSLFTSFTLRNVTFPNRVAVSPMSQYRAKNGRVNDWHLVHLGRFALGGAGLVYCEATAVEDRGRRTHGDLGIWSDTHTEGHARIARFLTEEGAVPGIQLGHAGRKASERRPWHGETPVDEKDKALRSEVPWQAVAPSALPFSEGWPVPHELTTAEICSIVEAFRLAAQRSLDAGYRVIEVYAAHGFLIHQFYSPIANRRTDEYGGDFVGRTRLAREVARAIRDVWPEDRVLAFRLSATDWLDDGWTGDDTVELARALKQDGVDMIDCSTAGIGGVGYRPHLPVARGFQIPFAERIRREANMPAMAVGLIWNPAEAEAAITEGRADMIALAREMLNNPNWPLHAARTLGADPNFSMWKPEFGWWLDKRQRAIDKLGLDD